MDNKAEAKKQINKLMRKLYMNHLETLHIHYQIINVLDNNEYYNSNKFIRQVERHIDNHKDSFINLTEDVDFFL